MFLKCKAFYFNMAQVMIGIIVGCEHIHMQTYSELYADYIIEKQLNVIT